MRVLELWLAINARPHHALTTQLINTHARARTHALTHSRTHAHTCTTSSYIRYELAKQLQQELDVMLGQLSTHVDHLNSAHARHAGARREQSQVSKIMQVLYPSEPPHNILTPT